MQGLEVFWGSGYKTPNVTKRPKQNAQLQNDQCKKTPNAKKRPNYKTPLRFVNVIINFRILLRKLG